MVLLVYIIQLGADESIHFFYEKIIKEVLGYYHWGIRIMRPLWWNFSIYLMFFIMCSPCVNPFVFDSSGKTSVNTCALPIPDYLTDWHLNNNNSFPDNIISVSNFQQGQKTFVESNNVSVDKSKDGPMDSAWPMYGHDVTHTGRSPFSTENNSGVEIWRVQSDGAGAIWSSAITDNNGIIYIGTKGSTMSLYALYPNGTRKWRFIANGAIWATPTIAENGDIYCTTWGTLGYLQAITQNGTERWHFDPEIGSVSAPTIGFDGTIYFGTDGQNIFAVNPDGTEKWRYTTGFIVMGSPAIGLDGAIYIGSGDHYLYALNPDGTLRWRYATGGEIKGSASLALDGTIYVPSFDGYLYALYPNGTMRWRVSTGDSLAAAGVALGKLGTIYVGTEMLRAYNPDGTLKWMTDVQGSIYGTVPAVSADGTIYVSAGFSLVAVNPDGSEKWRQQLNTAQVRSSPSIGLDDRVYVGSENPGMSPRGYLHAFGILDPDAPTAPTIIGRIRGTIEKSYDYIFRSTSSLGNDVFYQIDWGDGSLTDWLGPYDSGESMVMNHSWSDKGTYTIKARAKDIDNLWGPWGELKITMPFSYEPQVPFIQWLLECFPNAFPFLRQIIGY
jgi:outer membrane protein assembly factor BamB